MKKITTLVSALLLCLNGILIAESIRPKQVIQVTIQGVPAKDATNITGTYTVNSSGFIRLWPQKEIKASGLSGDGLARKIESMYKAAELFTNPTVQIRTSENEKLQEQNTITVGGDVRSPGPRAHSRDMTLYTAVMAAGGPTEFGKVTEVQLYRNGKRYVYNLKNAQHKLLKIYPNDTIEIPRKGLWDGFRRD